MARRCWEGSDCICPYHDAHYAADDRGDQCASTIIGTCSPKYEEIAEEGILTGGLGQRARDASTASMVNAIRRGSVKISWPIPSSDEDHTLLTAQLPGPVTVSSQTIRAPARPPRDDEGGQAAVAVALGAHAVGLAPASSREHLRQGNVPAKLQGVNSKPLGAGDAGNTSSNQPKRKRGSVRSIIRRFLRRSTVKEGRGSGRLQKSGSEAGRLGHHRSVWFEHGDVNEACADSR